MSRSFLALVLLFVSGTAALAEDASSILDGYARQARKEDPAFNGFSEKRGRELYMTERSPRGTPVSCATCHTPDPRTEGKTRANKAVKPLAPSANPERFTDPAKAEKWFTRNCRDVLERTCTAREKGDFITYVRSFH